MQNIISKYTKWKNFKITQIELQHNEKYNYQSTLAQEIGITANLENIVIIIYLTDEKGFRLVKKNDEKTSR